MKKLRYNQNLSKFHLLVSLILIVLFFREINFFYFYLSFSILYIFGVEIGYHKIMCHGLKVYKPFEYFCVYLGSLTHIGGLRDTIYFHLHHHKYSDTILDNQKKFFNAINPEPGKIEFFNRFYAKKIGYVRSNSLYRLIDKKFYLFLIVNFVTFAALFGFKNFLFYLFIPSSTCLLVHRYSAFFFHTFGYCNFNVPNKSKNVWWLFPLTFGENWHNNHHKDPKKPNNQYRWWEIDLAYLSCYFFVKRTDESILQNP